MRGASSCARYGWAVSTRYRLLMALGGLVVGVATATGCSGDTAITRPVPADMLLSPVALPDGFTTAPLTVDDLTSANARQLDVAAAATVTPAQCRPVADVRFNKSLTPANAAVLGATSVNAGLTEVASTQTRDVVSDIRTSTRDCARTTTVLTTGSLKGAVITTDHVQLDDPAFESSTPGYVGRVGSLRVVDVFVVRSTAVTRIADGTASTSVSLAGYATGRFTFDAADAAPVTVQLTSSSTATEFAAPAPTAIAPMSDAAFVELFGKALNAAGATRR